MGLLKQTQQQYYDVKKSFTGDGTTAIFTVSNSSDTFPTSYNSSNAKVYVGNNLILNTTYSFSFSATDGWHVDFLTPSGGTAFGAPANNAEILIDVESNFGNYQHISVHDIINNFIVSYVGKDKIINRVDRTDIAFHAQRALQEFSYDTLKSIKSQEISLPASLTMILPHDYVNYVEVCWLDSSGMKHKIYPTTKTSNPQSIKQDEDGNYSFDIDDDTTVSKGLRDDTTDLIDNKESTAWSGYKSVTPYENAENNDYQDDIYWPMVGQRYGLDPYYAQVNGSFYIDELKGMIHFSSNISGKTVVLKYISDGVGTDEEMILHKFAEEAMYKYIAYAVLSTKVNTPEHIVQRFKKEKFAATRQAKLRLSNLKSEELAQVMRGKSKHIKH